LFHANRQRYIAHVEPLHWSRLRGTTTICILGLPEPTERGGCGPAPLAVPLLPRASRNWTNRVGHSWGAYESNRKRYPGEFRWKDFRFSALAALRRGVPFVGITQGVFQRGSITQTQSQPFERYFDLRRHTTPCESRAKEFLPPGTADGGDAGPNVIVRHTAMSATR